MADSKISAFLKAVVKYGGGNLVILILSLWYFNQFFQVSPAVITQILDMTLWLLWIETIYVMIASRVFWTIEKAKKCKAGVEVSEEIDGMTLTKATQGVGLEVLSTLGTGLKTLVEKDPKEKDKKEINKLLKQIDKELSKLGVGTE
jgi:hypothetical protein